ncbi:MAG: monovalent cation:proton antiporter-2 (CPA2) family protein [Alphaproteobacteria bacterium]
MRDVLVLLAAALAAVPLFERLRLGPVLGYLAAGVVIGPHGLALIGEMEGTRALADLGVVFLLFTIGLELTFERLKSFGGMVYGLGLGQIVLSAGVIAWAVAYSGHDMAAAIIVGGALAMSSTAIVLQVLGERGQLQTSFGNVALAILILQDLAVSPLLVLLEILERDGGRFGASLWPALLLAAVKAAAAIVAILVVGRIALQPMMRIVSGTRSPELFMAMTLLVALGTSWGTEMAGLSMAFGAFLAGLLIAETEYRHQVAADIEPFRGILLGLFFMTVGMTIDLGLAFAQVWLVTALVVALMGTKALLLGGLAMAFRFPFWRAFRLGGFLAQGGEFAFVLLGIGMVSHVVPSALGHLLVVVVALSMAATPLLVTVTGRFIEMLENQQAMRAGDLGRHAGEMDRHVVIIGFGEVGRIIARVLKAYDIPYLVMDMSPRRVLQGRAEGEPIFYGDAALASVLRAAGTERARSVVVATPDPVGTLRIVATLRRDFSHVPTYARGGDERTTMELHRAGIVDAVSEKTEVGLRLVGSILELEMTGQP